MSSGMRGRAGMILAFGLRQVARYRQRQVLKSFCAAGAGPLPPFASIMTDRTSDKPAYPTVPNEATSRGFFVSLFDLMPSSNYKQITPAFSVGRRRGRRRVDRGKPCTMVPFRRAPNDRASWPYAPKCSLFMLFQAKNGTFAIFSQKNPDLANDASESEVVPGFQMASYQLLPAKSLPFS